MIMDKMTDSLPKKIIELPKRAELVQYRVE